MVKTPHFQVRGRRFDPWLGAKILHALQCDQKKKVKKKKLYRKKTTSFNLYTLHGCFHPRKINMVEPLTQSLYVWFPGG